MEGDGMIVYFWTADYRSYGFSPDLWGGNTTMAEVPDSFSGGGVTYDPQSGNLIPDPPYIQTEEDISREHELRRGELLEASSATTEDWRAYASIDEISDEDRVKLKAWLEYNKAVKSTAVGEEWPPVPES